MKTLRPLANSSRNTVLIDYREKLTPKPPKTPRRLLKILKKKSVRNNSPHKGGRHKRFYRVIERLAKCSLGNPYRKDGMEGEVMAIKYDPNRNCFNAQAYYSQDNSSALLLAPEGLKVGDKIISGESETVSIKVGNNLPLKFIPAGIPIHNLELKPGKGGQLIRSAGTYAVILAKGTDIRGKKYCKIKLSSGEERLILEDCRATIGEVGNSEANRVLLGKAGRSRWRGICPTVRGVATNPVDGRGGGGEGKKGKGKPDKKRGKKTRSKKNLSSKYITRSRHQAKRS